MYVYARTCMPDSMFSSLFFSLTVLLLILPPSLSLSPLFFLLFSSLSYRHPSLLPSIPPSQSPSNSSSPRVQTKHRSKHAGHTHKTTPPSPGLSEVAPEDSQKGWLYYFMPVYMCIMIASYRHVNICISTYMYVRCGYPSLLI